MMKIVVAALNLFKDWLKYYTSLICCRSRRWWRAADWIVCPPLPLYHISKAADTITVCWQVCVEIWSLARVPGEPELLEWLVRDVTSLCLIEPDRQRTYVCVLGLVINTWAAEAPATASEWRHFLSLWFEGNKVNHPNYTHTHTCANMLSNSSQEAINKRLLLHWIR